MLTIEQEEAEVSTKEAIPDGGARTQAKEIRADCLDGDESKSKYDGCNTQATGSEVR